MVTFTPAALLEDPWIVNKTVEAIQSNVTWHAYIEPKVIGTLTLRKADDDVAFALERVLEEIAFSNDFAPYPLALTSPPRRGFIEEFEWADAQYTRADNTSEELRKSCEEEVIKAYEKELEEMPKEAQEDASKAKPKEPEVNGGGWGGDAGGWGPSNGAGQGEGNGGGWGDDNGGGGGWGNGNTGGDGGGWEDANGNSTGAADGWGSPAQNQTGRGSPTPNAAAQPDTEASAPRVDLSQIASDKRIQEMSNAVIEGLKTMQIQPCFMREIRRFIVIDSKARAKEREKKASKIEVEVITAEQFIADFTASG
ncbi:hypothetical protein FRC07_012281 [Ceratobasidium sp. 392]|nr:hypothetical protein FRC07_012281 [Ceratobasidium sp. 392]